MGGNAEVEQHELGLETRDLAEYVGIPETPLEHGEVRVGKSVPDLGDRVRVSIHRENPQAGGEKDCRVSSTTRGAIDSPALRRSEARYLIGKHGSVVGHRRHGQEKKVLPEFAGRPRDSGVGSADWNGHGTHGIHGPPHPSLNVGSPPPTMWIATAEDDNQQKVGGGEPQSWCGAGFPWIPWVPWLIWGAVGWRFVDRGG